MRKSYSISVALVLATSFLGSAPIAFSAAQAKAGAACTKAKATQVVSNKKFTCVKVGKALKWDKGAVIAVAKPSASPTPTETPSTPASPAPREGGPCGGQVGKTFEMSDGQMLLCKVEGDGNVHWVAVGHPNTPQNNGGSSSSTAGNTNSTLQPIPAELSSKAVELCKIKDQRTRKLQPNNVGFPYTNDVLPNVGNMKIAFIPVDFPDAPGTTDPYDNSNTTFLKMKDWYKEFTNGKVTLEAQMSHQWFHASVASGSYGNMHGAPGSDDTTGGAALRLAQEWVSAAGDSYNFSGVSAIFFEFPSTVKGFGDGTQGRGVLLNTKQGSIKVVFNLPGNYWFQDTGGTTAELKQAYMWSYYIHELLHSTGLALHAPGNGFPIGLAQNQTPIPGGAFSGVLNGWSLFLANWLNDSQVFCEAKSSLNVGSVNLTPIDEIATPGKKIAVIAVSDSKALVIESRRPSGWSKELSKDFSGILVYYVDTTLDSDRSHESTGDTGNQPEYSKWAFLLPPDGTPGDASTRRGYNQYIVRVNQSVTFEGVKITSLRSDSGDTFKVEKVG